MERDQPSDARSDLKPRRAGEPSERDRGRPGQPPWGSRFDAFRDLAERRARGEQVMLPRYLPALERRLHIRQTLREDHTQRIHRRPEGAKAKFARLATDLYAFFRGTGLLFYRDLTGEDAWKPTVLALGDVHPENFGVIPSADDTPMFGVNDFDEADFAPFTWDLKRGSVGFVIAARAHGLKRKQRARVVEKFVRGYLAALREFARDDSETQLQLRLDNSPPLIRKLLRSACIERERWLAKYLDEHRRRFVATESIVPAGSCIQEIEAALAAYRETNPDLPRRAGNLVVKDVAEKKSGGTASVGLPRYWVLCEGPHGDGTDDFVLELKRARRSSLAGLAPAPSREVEGEADRVVKAQAVHLVGGDPFYGTLELRGESYIVRERSPFKKEIDLAKLRRREWYAYAEVCGRALAQAHALADRDTGTLRGDVERRILDAVQDDELLVRDLVRFARVTTERMKRDFRAFVRDHRRGAFRFADRVWD